MILIHVKPAPCAEQRPPAGDVHLRYDRPQFLRRCGGIPNTFHMLAATHLECVRGSRKLFTALELSAAPHTLVEVRGPNGSGKTTLLRALCGLHAPVAGNITWNGTDIRQLGESYREQVAYLGHLNAIHGDLTAIENLLFLARLATLPGSRQDIHAALQWAGLEHHLHQPCATLSQGQRRRVALARLRLASRRPLWILDEPFAALDADGLALSQQLLSRHIASGGMIVLSAHQELSIASAHVLNVNLGAV